jgi:multicomponent Na+:H+ antiporter subunit D
MRNLPALLVLLPLCGTVFGLAVKEFKSDLPRRVCEWLAAFTGLVLPLVVLFLLLPQVRSGGFTYTMGNRGGVLGIAQRFDGLAWLTDFMGFSTLLVVWIYTRDAGPRGSLFTTLFLIQATAMAGMASCADLFNLFICFEVLAIANYALVALAEKPKAFFASFNYLAVSSASLTFFLLGVFGFYRLTGSLSYEGIVRGLAALPDGGGNIALLSLAAISTASLVRVAVMPLAGWLPDAHGAAPHAVTAVGCGMLLKPPLFALGRFIFAFTRAGGAPGRIAAPLWEILGVLGTFTALGGVILALFQSDVKRLLAYHSISQVGYVVSAWALASPPGLAAAFLHAAFHSVFKGLLFLTVGSAVDAGNNRDVYAYRGAAKFLALTGDRRGITVFSFLIAALSIAAVPPFSGFASKHGILHSLEHIHWQYRVLSLAGVGTMASMIKLSRIFFGSPGPLPEGTDHAYGVQGPYRIGFFIKAAMVLWALPCALLGVFSSPLGRFVKELLGAGHNPVPENLFSLSSLAHTLFYAAAATGLYLLLNSKKGKALVHRVQELPVGFYGLMAGFAAALWIIAAGMKFIRPGE